MGCRHLTVLIKADSRDPEAQAVAQRVLGEVRNWVKTNWASDFDLRDPCFDQSSLAGVVVKILVIDRDGLSDYVWRPRIFESSYRFAAQINYFLRASLERASEVNLEFRI